MKIRSNFVTNSSSTATTELVVENPVLLEILERYKKLGAFGAEDTTFGIGEYATPPSDIYYFGRHTLTEIQKPAFSFREDPGGDGWDVGNWVPQSLSEILELIIYIMDKSKGYKCQSEKRYYYFYNEYDQELYSQMIEELKQQEENINASYTKVNYLRTDEGKNVDDLVNEVLNDMLVEVLYDEQYRKEDVEEYLKIYNKLSSELYDELYDELYKELIDARYDELHLTFDYSQAAGAKSRREAVRYDRKSGKYLKWELDDPEKE